MNEHSLIRTIYLYLFSLVGLFFLVFGLVNFTSAALNRYVWPQEFSRTNYSMPMIEGKTEPAITLEEQKADFLVQQNNEFKRGVTSSIPAVVVGWLLWWFHWGWIKRDRRKLIER